MIPDIEAFEEMAAICQHDGGYSHEKAEHLAAKAQGFDDAAGYWKWLADYVVHRQVPMS